MLPTVEGLFAEMSATETMPEVPAPAKERPCHPVKSRSCMAFKGHSSAEILAAAAAEAEAGETDIGKWTGDTEEGSTITSNNSSSSGKGGGGTGLDPRYTYCEFCKSKHTKKVWGTPRRISEEAARSASKKSVYRLHAGSWVCEAAYLFVTDTTGNIPPPKCGGTVQCYSASQHLKAGPSKEPPAASPKKNDSTITATPAVSASASSLGLMSKPWMTLAGASTGSQHSLGPQITTTSSTEANLAGKRALSMTHSEPEKKLFKVDLDKVSELKRRAESLALTQRVLNNNIRGLLLGLEKCRTENASQPTQSPKPNEQATRGEKEGEESMEVDTKKLDDVLTKIENAQGLLVKTRYSDVLGKLTNDLFTELARLKYEVIDFKKSIEEK